MASPQLSGRARQLALRRVFHIAAAIAGISFVCAFTICPRCPAAPGRTVRVGLLSSRILRSIEVTSPGGTLLSSGTGKARPMGTRTWRFEAAGDTVKAREGGGPGAMVMPGFTIRGKSPSAVVGVGIRGSDARGYRGSIAVRAGDGRLVVVNWVPLADYLRSVVPLEMPPSAPKAALRAQAVAARSFAIAAQGRHGRKPYDFCDLPHCQLYLGARSESPKTDAAISVTEGQVLTEGGKPIEAVFHSCCGGATSAIQDVWGGGTPVPYLVSRSDLGPHGAYCRRAPHFRWQFTVSAASLLRALRTSKSTDPGTRLRSIQVLQRDDAGRATEVEIVGDKRVTVTGSALRTLLSRTLGSDKMKSARFAVGRRNDQYVFEGTGHGHGVGMCHWGAMGRAEAGETYQEILGHYYPGTVLGHLS